jgi:hypothetical protein
VVGIATGETVAIAWVLVGELSRYQFPLKQFYRWEHGKTFQKHEDIHFESLKPSELVLQDIL